MEAFSDGVIAIIITIMVLELKVPHEASLKALVPVAPVFLSYVLSFVFLGIYWSNHHHLLQAVEHVNGRVLWANLHLLFWLSLTPFVTGWMGENNFAALPAALYGVVLLFAAIAYFILARTLVSLHGKGFRYRHGAGRGFQGQDLDGDLSGGDSAGVCEVVVGLCAVRAGGGDVAGSGSAD